MLIKCRGERKLSENNNESVQKIKLIADFLQSDRKKMTASSGLRTYCNKDRRGQSKQLHTKGQGSPGVAGGPGPRARARRRARARGARPRRHLERLPRRRRERGPKGAGPGCRAPHGPRGLGGSLRAPAPGPRPGRSCAVGGLCRASLVPSPRWGRSTCREGRYLARGPRGRLSRVARPGRPCRRGAAGGGGALPTP